jgi:cellulose binding protein with CBM2 domain
MPMEHRYVALAAAAVVLLGGAGTVMTMHKPGHQAGPRRHAQISYCGLVACSAVPAGPAAASAPGRLPRIAAPHRAHAHLARAPKPSSLAPPHSAPPVPVTRPAPPARRKPAPAPASASAAPVTVTYSVPQHSDRGFQGEFTIANHGRSPLVGWRITVSLPGDRLVAVRNAIVLMGRENSVILVADLFDRVIMPGDSLSVSFSARGTATSPASCTFDGSACR